MKFRTRLLILLLAISLLPLSLSFLFQHTSMLHFGNKVASDTHTLLNDNAESLLHSLVDNFGRILKRDKAMGLLTLQIQAQAVEQRLCAPKPKPAQKVFFSSDYASVQNCPKDLVETKKRRRPGKDGKLIPIPVSYSQQVIFLAPGTKAVDVADQIRRMSTMPEVYRTLHNIQPDLFLWQFTGLETGLHSSYPGKGGYPASYDPRQRLWYKNAVASGKMSQQILADVTTGTLILSLSKPLYSADGKLLGVTGLDIDYRQFFTDWKIPSEWVGDAKSMVLIYHESATDPAKKLEILLCNKSEDHSLDWRMPVKHEYLDISQPQLQQLRQDLQNGNSAVRKIVYQGQECLWAYSSRSGDEPFPLVIVPFKQIIAQATDAENYVNQQMSLSIKISALLTVLVVISSMLLAIARSKKVTRPILQLATAAKRLAQGNFDARVEIQTGDELEELGNVFNEMNDSLKERDRLKQSLVLAKEVQQRLLPEVAPQCPKFDLAAKSIYCDETGGDYFDFIPLRNFSEDCLGLAVGDVSGHGIGSALVMATARGVLHSLVECHKFNLEALVGELNNHLCRGTANDEFMTMFYGILNHEECSLDWISAGHAPMFFYSMDGQVQQLGSSGIPLGIIEDIGYEKSPKIKFSVGDIMLIGTDGIWETRNVDGEMFGSDRVVELLIRHAADDAATITGQLIAELDKFRGNYPQDDDITLMVVKAC